MTLTNIHPGLRAYLLADSNISTTVGGSRIYPLVLPQGEQDASIVLQRISGLGDHHATGASGLSRPRMQIDSYAATFAAAVALANLVKERIDGKSVTMGSGATQVVVQGVFFDSERDDYDKDAELYRVSQDYFIWYAER